jgi:hypothetical protein
MLVLYEQRYLETENMLKSENIKNRLFFRKNRLTPHSRVPPEALRSYWHFVKGLIYLSKSI